MMPAMTPLLANIAPLYLACEDLAEGALCRTSGPTFGNCLLDTLCVDQPIPAGNECFVCVDGCWSPDKDEGDTCVQPDGSEGVCRMQPEDTCTDDPAKSFNECMRCEPPDPIQPKDGCSAVDAATALPWALLLAAGLWQLRRR